MRYVSHHHSRCFVSSCTNASSTVNVKLQTKSIILVLNFFSIHRMYREPSFVILADTVQRGSIIYSFALTRHMVNVFYLCGFGNNDTSSSAQNQNDVCEAKKGVTGFNWQPIFRERMPPYMCSFPTRSNLTSKKRFIFLAQISSE